MSKPAPSWDRPATHDYLYAAYVLILIPGLRKGEVLGLTWDHNQLGRLGQALLHGVQFCEHCHDNHDISLVINKQLQLVRGRLLYG